MTTWTFAIDESGRPEGAALEGESDERLPFVLGGPLLPYAADKADAVLREALRQAGEAVGVVMPPHGSAMKPHQREALRAAAGAAVAAAGGYWLFIIDQPSNAKESLAQLLRYVRVLATAIDAATRVVGLNEGAELDVRVAQRTIGLSATQTAQLATSGVAHRTVDTEDGAKSRVLIESEVRQVIESISREPAGSLPRPRRLHSIVVESATARSGHAGLWAADVGTNGMRELLKQRERVPTVVSTPSLGGAVVLAARDTDLRGLRQFDRSLRRDPPRLTDAADFVERACSSEETSSFGDLLEGAWNRALDSLGRLGQHDIARLTEGLIASSEQILAEKPGAYEGLWRALEGGWVGTSDLARKIREQAREPSLRMRFARAVAECANHRGDVVSTGHAVTEFQKAVGARRSLRVIADRLYLQNLVAVQAQNRLPCDDERERAEVEQAIRDRTAELMSSEREMRAMLELAQPDGSAPLVPSAEEVELSALLGSPSAPSFPDPDRGMALGTVARSYGFLGEIDAGLEAAMAARALFRDSERDLRFNAAVLTRLLLEEVRLGGGRSENRRRAREIALAIAGVELRSTKWARRDQLSKSKALRFPIDLALRALLWLPECKDRSAPWLELLSANGEGSLLAELTSERSHPTELIARHAAELCNREGKQAVATRWFELAALCASGAEPGSTLERLGVFTQRLAQGELAGVREPRFEYR